jgi:hypothetical protein
MKVKTNRCQTAARPVKKRRPISSVTSSTYACVQSIRRRRSTRSASTPPTRLVNRNGRKRTPLIRPRRAAEPVISSTSQLSAICCNHWPVDITTVPNQRRR